jgi:hypothetical protein
VEILHQRSIRDKRDHAHETGKLETDISYILHRRKVGLYGPEIAVPARVPI